MNDAHHHHEGEQLASRLNPYIGTTSKIREICSLITRHATTYSWIQERWCNVEMPDRIVTQLEAKESRLEDRITELVMALPETDGGPFAVQFDGDPRGYVVRLVTPDGREIGVA